MVHRRRPHTHGPTTSSNFTYSGEFMSWSTCCRTALSTSSSPSPCRVVGGSSGPWGTVALHGQEALHRMGTPGPYRLGSLALLALPTLEGQGRLGGTCTARAISVSKH
jgi:hypothetical protein